MDNDKITKSYTDGYAIKISPDSSSRCSICFDAPQPELCKSLEKLNVLCNLIISPSYDKISFLINSIKSLQHVTDPKHDNYQKFTYSNGISMAKCIGFQIFHLEQAERTLSWLTMKNIYVIVDTYYIYLGVKEVVEINRDHFTIFSPILKGFCFDILKQTLSLKSTNHIASCIFSFPLSSVHTSVTCIKCFISLHVPLLYLIFGKSKDL